MTESKASETVVKLLGYVDDAMVEKGYRKCIAAAGGNTEIIFAIELERKGGKCPLCDRSYAKIIVDNRFGKFTYFRPSCFCFKQCDLCQRYLVSEKLLNISHCTHCHPNGVQEHKKHTNGKRRFRDGKAAASGEEE